MAQSRSRLGHLQLDNDADRLRAATNMLERQASASTTRRYAGEEMEQPQPQQHQHQHRQQQQQQPQQHRQPQQRQQLPPQQQPQHRQQRRAEPEPEPRRAHAPEPPVTPAQRDEELELAQREVHELRQTVRQQQKEIEQAMAQVHDSSSKRERHKSDLMHLSQSHADEKKQTQAAHQRDVDSLRRELDDLRQQLDMQAGEHTVERAQHDAEVKECIRKQRLLQSHENEMVKEMLANATELQNAEESHAVRQEQNEKRLRAQSDQYAQQRQQREEERRRERQAHKEELATTNHLKEEKDFRNHSQEAELKRLRKSLHEKEVEYYEAQRKAELGLEDVDQLRSEQKIELANQNKELETLKLEAERRAQEMEAERQEFSAVQEGLQSKVNELVLMLHDLTTQLENRGS